MVIEIAVTDKETIGNFEKNTQLLLAAFKLHHRDCITSLVIIYI